MKKAKKKAARKKVREKLRKKARKNTVAKKSSAAHPRIEIRSTKSLPPVALQNLFRAAGWKGDLARYSGKKVKQKLNRTHVVISAWQGKELVGFGSAVSDGVLCAMVDNLLVHPKARSRGVGALLLKRLTRELRRQGGEYIFGLGTRSPKANRFFEGSGYQLIPWRVFLHSPR